MDKRTSEKAKKETSFGFYRKNVDDQADIGFYIKGVHFRWINPRKQENQMDREWVPFTAELAKAKWPSFYKAVTEGSSTHKDARRLPFKDDGKVYWGGQYLGCMEDEAHKRLTDFLDEENRLQLERINAAPESNAAAAAHDSRAGFKVKAEAESSKFGIQDFTK